MVTLIELMVICGDKRNPQKDKHHCNTPPRFKVQSSLLFVTYTIIQGIIGSEMLIRTGPLNGKCKKKLKKT